MRRVFCALAALCLPLTAATAENDLGAWTIFSTTDAFRSDEGTTRWHYWFDAQARYFDLGSGTNQWLARPAIGYRLDGNMKIWLGYARFRSHNRAGNVGYESRYWQQLDWTAGLWLGGNVSMRARLEQRDVSAGDDLGVVLRFMTKYVRPMNDSTDLIVALEPFVDLVDTDWGGDAGLGQNRTFIGVGWRLGDGMSLETGYMNQYLWVDRAPDRMNHLGIVNFKVRL